MVNILFDTRKFKKEKKIEKKKIAVSINCLQFQ